MRLVLMGIIVILTIAMIFTGSRDAAQMHEDYEKYKGDKLVKAISEYNEKAIKGYVGEAGVTRTPMLSGNTPKVGKPGQSGYQMPSYMMNQKPPSYYSVPSDYNPYNPYKKSQQDSNQYAPPPATQPAQQGGGDGYYPPPPIQQQPYPPQSQRPTGPGFKEYVVPMNLPEQPWPKEMLRLRTGQQIAFAGTDVYTYDDRGNPIPLPDGEYYLGVGNYKFTVKNGRKYNP